MRLRDLDAKFTAHVANLPEGVFTGLFYRCPNDPRRKRAHSVLFRQVIIPVDYLAFLVDGGGVQRFVDTLNLDEGYCLAPKWNRWGSSLDDLTLDPSIAQYAGNIVGKPECCHLTISNGEARPG